MDLKNLVPGEWKVVHEKNYELLNVQNTENIKCLGAFVIGEGGEANVVSFLNYVGYNRDFLIVLDKTFEKFNEEDKLVDGDPSDEDYVSTALVSNLFHGFSKFMGKVVYVNINKVAVASGVSGYSFQVFVEAENGLNCVQTSLRNVDDKNVVESVLSQAFVQKIIDILLKISK